MLFSVQIVDGMSSVSISLPVSQRPQCVVHFMDPRRTIGSRPSVHPGAKVRGSLLADRHNRVTVYFCHRRLNELFTCEGEVIASGGTAEESPA